MCVITLKLKKEHVDHSIRAFTIKIIVIERYFEENCQHLIFRVQRIFEKSDNLYRVVLMKRLIVFV